MKTSARTLLIGTTIAAVIGAGSAANAGVHTLPTSRAAAAVRSPGDIDGDGLDDLVVGSRHGVQIHYTHATPNGDAPQTLTPPNRAVSALAVGDFNGDGYADVAIGDRTAAPTHQAGMSRGKVFVWYGRAAGINPGRMTSVRGPSGGDAFGSGLDAVRFNGDRYRDLVVHSASGIEPTQVLLGSTTGLHRTTRAELPTEHAAGVVSADVDGDGHPELIVGRPDTGRFVTDQETGITEFEGTVAVFPGTAAGTGTKPQVLHGKRLVGFQGLGHALAVGHFNADRYADVAVSATGSSDAATDGNVVVFYGGPHGLSRTHTTVLGADLPQFGQALSAGDVTGDGVDDLVVGGGLDFSGTSNGAVYLFLGTAAGVQLNGPEEIDADVLGDVGKQAPAYGAAVVIYRPNSSAAASLAVGAPEYWSNSGVFDAGFVDFFPGGPSGADLAHGRRAYHGVENAAVGSYLAP